ncbi:ethanolamine ammonia-lyase subunit EutC [Frigidibacter sp. MR17.24]|uniref:ethanolamine ammonia-lyase subunit EutC n=1 Tax=Frigidibacter sp. MR17.24 TaxID=3127345 RepID=UPI00301309FB
MSGRDLTDLSPRLRALTPARVRLDAAGGPSPLAAVLDFQASHARARDAIRQPVDWDAVRGALGGRPSLDLHSRASDRDTYIRRPDLGRRLDAASLARVERTGPDLCLVIADGLSALAVRTHAAAMVAALAAALPELSIGPVALVREGRVAVGDEIAEAMGAPLCLVLIGERPGLSVSDSLGAYLTWQPRVGTPDSSRNCVSNIHANGGLDHARASDLLAYLIRRAREIGATGVALKDDRAPVLPAP